MIKNNILRMIGFFSPSLALKLRYFSNRKRWPNLQQPKDISEILIRNVVTGKINTLSELADKYAVRKYVSEKGLNDILVPLLGVYNNVEDIDFTKLPNSFALKLNYGAGMNVICKDKAILNIDKAKNKLNKWLTNKCSYSVIEQHYNFIPRKIICEAFIDDGTGELPIDYKIMCIKGSPICILACANRGYSNEVHLPFDLQWNFLSDWSRQKLAEIPKPTNLNLMLDIAKSLSSGLDVVRVDLYSVHGKIYFGELTLTPSGCIFNNWTQKALDELGYYYLKEKLPKS